MYFFCMMSFHKISVEFCLISLFSSKSLYKSKTMEKVNDQLFSMKIFLSPCIIGVFEIEKNVNITIISFPIFTFNFSLRVKLLNIDLHFEIEYKIER